MNPINRNPFVKACVLSVLLLPCATAFAGNHFPFAFGANSFKGKPASIKVSSAEPLETSAEKHEPLEISSVTGARLEALIEEAWAVGFRQGYHRQIEIKRQAMEALSHRYDRIYQFNHLLMDGDVLPPVISITEGVSSLSFSGMESNEILRHYKILTPAKIVASNISWRSWFRTIAPSRGTAPPPLNLDPQSSVEKNAWDNKVRQGSNKGKKVANDVFSLSAKKLQRDFKGMLIAIRLMEEGMLSRPVIRKESKVVVVNEDKSEMALHTTARTIMAPAQLIGDSTKWMPIVVFGR